MIGILNTAENILFKKTVSDFSIILSFFKTIELLQRQFDLPFTEMYLFLFYLYNFIKIFLINEWSKSTDILHSLDKWGATNFYLINSIILYFLISFLKGKYTFKIAKHLDNKIKQIL